MKKVSVIAGLLMLMPLITIAQNLIDSLQKKLASSSPDTNRVSIIGELAMAYMQRNVDTSRKYLHEGLMLARQLGFKKGEADCLRRTGIIHYMQGRYPEALDIFQKAQTISESINHNFGIGAGLGHIGNIYAEQGDWEKARSYYQRYWKIAESLGNQYEQSNALIKLGEGYLEQDILDSALVSLNRAHVIVSSRHSDKRMLGTILKNLGKLQLKKDDKKQAIAYFYEGVTVATEANSSNVLSDIYIEIARLFKTSGQQDSCIFYGLKAFAAAQKNNYAKNIVAASKILAEGYEPVNEHEALKFFKIASSVNDSLFNREKATQVQNLFFLEQQRKEAIEVADKEYRNKLKFYFLIGALLAFLLIAIVLYYNNRTKQKANTILSQQKQEIQQQRTNAEKALIELKATQVQLIQSEKMASLGELTAGIAHEIQNPLNFVNNFSEVNKDLLQEMNEEIEKGNFDEVKAIAKDIRDNEQKINHHGKRADAIVKGMLQHSKSSSGQKELTDINALADEYLRLAYHGLRAKDKSFNSTAKTEFDNNIGKINVNPQDMGRVILNLINNAFYAVNEKQKQNIPGYEPTVTISTGRSNGKIEIKVKDNGNGIPKGILDKIFQPFFTTKPTGQGTGLGLSLSYDIVKAHGGELNVATKEGSGSVFTIQLPFN
jgi:two-component system, NtrC family, sensor kinase